MQENFNKTTKCRLVKQRYTKGHKKEWNQLHLQLNEERIKKRQKKLQSDYKLQTFAFD